MYFKFGFSLFNIGDYTYISDISRNLRPIKTPCNMVYSAEKVYAFIPGLIGARCLKNRGNFRSSTLEWDYSIDINEIIQDDIIIVNSQRKGVDLTEYYPHAPKLSFKFEPHWYGLHIKKTDLNSHIMTEHLHAISYYEIYKDLLDK